jgi:polyphosphate kinase
MSERFINRELSWLEFNQRVLEEAEDPTVPLLERLKFLAIVSSNLDEFFMVRVAGLRRQLRTRPDVPGPDGLTPAAAFAAVAARARQLSEEQHRCFLDHLKPLLAAEGVHLVGPKELSAKQEAFAADYFRRRVLPVATPLAIDPGHPFPHLANRALCLVVSLSAAAPSPLPSTELSLIHIPAHPLPRFVQLPSPPGSYAFILLEDLIRLHLPTVYPGYTIRSCHAIRVTRDAEFHLAQDGETDLLTSIESGLLERRMGDAVRLQYDSDLPAEILATLVDELELAPDDLYEADGFIAFADLFQLYTAVDLPHLKDRPLPPRPVAAVRGHVDLWSAIQAGDFLVNHPYQSFDVVTRFVQEAATDPRVLAIKMTLYRVSPTSPIAQALRRAAERGKEVAVLVELQARFDEEANIGWARALEEVGAHVVYGLVGYKTHCKACLVVREETEGIRRYCHLATGNYNARTAGIYSDLGLFTCRPSFGEDLTELFNLLTGYTRPREFNHLHVAPIGLREALLARIEREAEHARGGRPARLIAKMNSLVDTVLIEALYAASAAGVDIDLIVRGICCLRPGVPGLSERIRISSIIDRYLEHARVFHFQNDGAPEYLLASADWMPRNLDRRVEIAFPILDPSLQRQVHAILDIQLADTVKARTLLADGRSRRARLPGPEAVRAQVRLHEIALDAGMDGTGVPLAP